MQSPKCTYLSSDWQAFPSPKESREKSCKTVESESALYCHCFCVLCSNLYSFNKTETATFYHTGHDRFKAGFGTVCFHYVSVCHLNVPGLIGPDSSRFHTMSKLFLQNPSFVAAPLVHGHVGLRPNHARSQPLHIFLPPPWALGLPRGMQTGRGGMRLESQIWTLEGCNPTNMQTTHNTSGTRDEVSLS